MIVISAGPLLTGAPLAEDEPAGARILVVDDHPIFRGGVVSALCHSATPFTTAEATTGAEALKLSQTAEEAIDLVLLAADLADGSAMRVAREIARKSGAEFCRPGERTRVLLMLPDPDAALLVKALRAGVSGCVSKRSTPEDLHRALLVALEGGVVFLGESAQVMRDFLGGNGQQTDAEAIPALTQREREALELVARGRSNAQIAQRLYLSEKTVRNHISRIFGKIRITRRAEAVAWARNAGFGIGRYGAWSNGTDEES